MTDTTRLIDEILATCTRIAKRGEIYQVHRFSDRGAKHRKACAKLKSEGRLVSAGRENPWLYFYRPEDLAVIEAAQARHREAMKQIHAKNVGWHLAQAEKCPILREYHMKEAEKERALAA